MVYYNPKLNQYQIKYNRTQKAKFQISSNQPKPKSTSAALTLTQDQKIFKISDLKHAKRRIKMKPDPNYHNHSKEIKEK